MSWSYVPAKPDSSTAFAAADRRAGRPWATRLPFPVHCLSKVETRDHVTGWRHVQTASYHHGFYDGVEREFRGFGLVQTRDAESFSDFKGNGDPLAHHVPPVLTKTWFHTGAFVDDRALWEAYATEWWDEDPHAAALSPSKLPTGLSPRTRREAHRALKGRLLREEVHCPRSTPQSRPAP